MKNVVLITIDSLRADHVGYHGYHRDITPFLDELSQKSQTFFNAYSQGHSTRLSFPSIFCSRFAHEDEGYESAPKGHPLLAEHLSENMVECAGFHSNTYLSSKFGYDRGFGKYYDSMDENEPIDIISRLIFSKIKKEGLTHRLLRTVKTYIESTGNRFLNVPYTRAEDLTGKAINWIDQTSPNDRHFLWVHYMDAHSPFIPPERDQEQVLGSSISIRKMNKLSDLYHYDNDRLDNENLKIIKGLYDSEIHYVDRNIENLINAVNSKWDEKLIIITSDHGEEFKDHSETGHSQIYDELLHVPLLINIEGLTKQNRYEELIALLDLAPTITDYFDITPPPSFRGDSVLPLIEKGEWGRQTVISEGIDPDTWQPIVSVRDSKYKYIRNNASEEIYNISDEKLELNNLSNNGGYNESRVQQLKRLAEEHAQGMVSPKFDETENLNDGTISRLEKLGYIDNPNSDS